MFVNCENQTVLSNLFTVAPNKCVYTKETLACREVIVLHGNSHM